MGHRKRTIDSSSFSLTRRIELLLTMISILTAIRRPIALAFSPPQRIIRLPPMTVVRSHSLTTDHEMIPPRVKTSHINDHFLSETITIQGWVRTIRKQKKFAFLQINDGSNLAGIQCVMDREMSLDGIATGAAVQIVGTVMQSQGGKQNFEVSATNCTLIGTCPPELYPLAKKRHSLEYLRTIAHLRPRTNTIAAVARVRSQLSFAIHRFFHKNHFVHLQTPLITSSDCEGAGEMFRVTTFHIDTPDQLPRNTNDTQTLDATQDFFGKPAYLTVSGQLAAETHACALGNVYTFGPTFRAENSQTTRHLAEFHMVEPELAFCDLNAVMDNAEQLLQSIITFVLEQCMEDLEFFNQYYDTNLLTRLKQVSEQPFVRISYKEAIAYLQEEISKDPSKWQFPNVEFGTDLATEHERWLAEEKFQTAVFVYNYPKAIKAFYMRDNDDNDNDTVAAMDLLVPGIGELIGGSQREERLDVLEAKMKELELDPADYWWYLDLRRFGSVPHSGYGLGFERLVTYVCGMENIRESIAFPRYPGNAEF